MKIEESEKAGSHRELNPGHLACATSALPPSYDNRMTTGFDNWVRFLATAGLFTSLYFSLFQHETRVQTIIEVAHIHTLSCNSLLYPSSSRSSSNWVSDTLWPLSTLACFLYLNNFFLKSSLSCFSCWTCVSKPAMWASFSWHSIAHCCVTPTSCLLRSSDLARALFSGSISNTFALSASSFDLNSACSFSNCCLNCSCVLPYVRLVPWVP